MCGRCGQVWHVVMAKMGDRIAKVVCKRCGGHHRYRTEADDTAEAPAAGADAAIPTLKIDAAPEHEQARRVQAVRERRDATAARAGLELVRRACESDSNIMQAVLEAARHDATLGEVCQVFRQVFGEYRDPAHV